ncbi:hypothetical protein E5Q_06666 [Mixia osmundae IAM 14324]|uniref:Amino acid transporter transmembrane domain-containing protein n=1 Tax=Mixia osmundae (strain CBS 9802 / IAM 14324 / JCM 22182 / KY 12970) TaxID=764103 RepID=G7EAV3_MIXOS|nr:hypothetical protein E5Q_06666 [Mixia osmundae IAM 14324]
MALPRNAVPQGQQHADAAASQGRRASAAPPGARAIGTSRQSARRPSHAYAAGQGPQQGQQGAFPSSLSYVWSYARSQTYYGDNLPTSPSFVDRYAPPSFDSLGSRSGRQATSGYGSTAKRSRSKRKRLRQQLQADHGNFDEPDLEAGSRDASEADSHSRTGTSEDDNHSQPSQSDESSDGSSSEDDRLSNHASIPTPFDASLAAATGHLQSWEPEDEWAARARTPSASPKRSQQKRSQPHARLPPTSTPPRRNASEQTPLLSGQTSSVNLGKPGETPAMSPLLPASYASTPSILTPARPSQRGRKAAPSGLGLPARSPPDGVPFPRTNHAVDSAIREHLESKRRITPADEHRGSSTFGQSLFNSINVLIGVGILAEPLAFAYAGWIGGTILLLFCGLITNYSAKVLARILADDPELHTFADIGAKAFGSAARTFISILFCLELSALSVALVVLFGDSMGTLFGPSSTTFKLIGFLIITPTVFLPLRLLSISSLVGIISVICLTVVISIDGGLKAERPGSLAHPMPTNIGPDWHHFPISFGLIMSGFAGHAVMPSLARDMKDPTRFNRMIDMAYVVVAAFYGLLAVFGYLMFGNNVSDEITRDLLRTPGFPQTLTKIAVVLVAINPVCKFALATSPLHSTVDYLLGIDVHQRGHDGHAEPSHPPLRIWPSTSRSLRHQIGSQSTLRHRTSSLLAPDGSIFGPDGPLQSMLSVVSQPLLNSRPPVKRGVRVLVKVATTAVVTLIAILLPQFEVVMSFLGSFSAFVICVIIPVSSLMRIFKSRLSRLEYAVDVGLLAISTIMALVGTTCRKLKLGRIARCIEREQLGSASCSSRLHRTFEALGDLDMCLRAASALTRAALARMKRAPFAGSGAFPEGTSQCGCNLPPDEAGWRHALLVPAYMSC